MDKMNLGFLHLLWVSALLVLILNIAGVVTPWTSLGLLIIPTLLFVYEMDERPWQNFRAGVTIICIAIFLVILLVNNWPFGTGSPTQTQPPQPTAQSAVDREIARCNAVMVAAKKPFIEGTPGLQDLEQRKTARTLKAGQYAYWYPYLTGEIRKIEEEGRRCVAQAALLAKTIPAGGGWLETYGNPTAIVLILGICVILMLFAQMWRGKVTTGRGWCLILLTALGVWVAVGGGDSWFADKAAKTDFAAVGKSIGKIQKDLPPWINRWWVLPIALPLSFMIFTGIISEFWFIKDSEKFRSVCVGIGLWAMAIGIVVSFLWPYLKSYF